jgi:hypothetical protein
MKFEMVITIRNGNRLEMDVEQNELRIYDYSNFSFYANIGTPHSKEEHLIHAVPIENNPHWDNLIEFLDTQKWSEFYTEEVPSPIETWGLIYENGPANITAGGRSSFPGGFKKMIRLLNEVLAPTHLKIHI